jgi:hypothetical protein
VTPRLAEYRQFLQSRKFHDTRNGVTVGEQDLTPTLKPHQRYIVRWALAKGRAAIFADTGLGKSRMMCEWGRLVGAHTCGRVLFLSPLAVAAQTVEEAAKVGLALEYARHDTGAQFIITNYEMVDKFDMSQFMGVVLDESSILKNFEGRIRANITTATAHVPFRLSCTATPSPNDHMELGTQSEFLGVMPRAEMLAMFFRHDASNTSEWVLKGHGRTKFWEWMATWAVVIRSPEDLGLDGSEYALPGLDIQYLEIPEEGPQAAGLTERREIKKASVAARAQLAATLANSTTDPVIVWCHRNDESEALAAAIPDAVELTGSDHIDDKEAALLGFSHGKHRVIVTKPKIAGFGMNWQHCNMQVFAGLTDSFEEMYQAIRRSFRYGQTRRVSIMCVLTSRERVVVENLMRKERQHLEMSRALMGHMRDHMAREVVGTLREYDAHDTKQPVSVPSFIQENAQ